MQRRYSRGPNLSLGCGWSIKPVRFLTLLQIGFLTQLSALKAANVSWFCVFWRSWYFWLVSCEGYGSDGTCDGEGVNPLGVSCCYLYWGWSSSIFCRNTKHLHKGVITREQLFCCGRVVFCSFWSHGACLDQGWMLWRGAEVGFEPRISGG